ncbi:Scr1 family TA system antitoxin-like transcriptional regulator [Streptomyces sp. ISL-11]|uniref:Scr1 family TA system antitoxin-like transcriptional regulator n=1 Tax=Streptomyces sp. ISL-11 TaxID=2819174 RepID=UPI001BE60831|nr:Scr1 family TA system antitoxin-like transcriptional regulator [Streptomyces sp. ISL-11]MBT2382038.1 helix-turn-helix transcriptional regulator [Streptomyces sp. ISL-11]
MPPRKAPTARQRRLGAELRKMREQAGLPVTQAAELLGTDRTSISNTESGRFGVSGERVRSWAANYGCPDAAYVEALASMADERDKGWWDDYHGSLSSGALDLAELEHHGVAFRAVQIMHMPGLLQSEDYARAVFEEAVPALSPATLRRRLSYRLRRRDVLDRDQPPHCVFLIHEAALRMQFGGPKVARAQLDYLLEQSERDNITVRVIPFAVGGFPHAGGSTLYVYGPVPQLDTVQTDTPMGSAFLDAESRLTNYRAALDRTEERSLRPEQSRDFIVDVARQA